MSNGERRRTTRWKAALVGLVAVVVVSACQPLAVRTLYPGATEPGSQLVGCEHAGEKLVVTVSSHLDPSCTYTRSVQITASNVVFDCRGAHITRDPAVNDRLGIEIVAPTTVALSNVTVRNCTIEDFATNSLRIRRDGFKSLPPGAEYDNGFSNIRVENSNLYGSGGSGLFVDGYVTGVTLTDLDIARSGSVGIYLEAGSKGTVVERNHVHDNGFADVSPEGVPITVGGVEFRYHSTGREGIAIDGSRDNVLRGNVIHDNAAGGVFVYKNCGENASSNGWWTRPYGSSGNLLDTNWIYDEVNGVWIGSRMAENQLFMECSDTPMIDTPSRKVYLDPAPDNVVRANRFANVEYGVRVEDDGNRIEANAFAGTTRSSVMIGTKERTAVLGRPVDRTVVVDNVSDGPTPEPYAWVYGHTGTTFTGNRTNGVASSLVGGTPPVINPFLFVKDVFLAP